MSICDVPTEASATVSKPELPEGVPALRAFYLYMSNTCNLRCRHCWITPRFGDGKETLGDFVDPGVLRQAVVEAKQLGLCSVKLTGGEPMLHPRFMDIADMLTAEGMSMDMETNGTLMTAEKARHLKEKTNVTFISVSLDAPDARSHDSFRGVPGAFDAAVRGLDCLVNAGYRNCQVIMSVHRGNRHQVEEVVALAAAHGANSVKFNPVTRTGRGAAMEESGEVMDFDEHLAFARYVSTELRPKARVGVILNMPPALSLMRDLLRTRGRTGDCGVLRILGVLGNGDIALCGIGRTVPELVYGKLGRDSIRDIWFSNPTILRLRQALTDVDALPSPCARCLFVRTCRTGCVANNYTESGSLIAPTWLCAEAERRGVFPSKRAQRKISGGEGKG
ncbi:radical SAM protein [candidate division WOR-3 bacterium]|nr:radical SAM protein [candidate division WOR-3 bacterium]